MLLGRRSLRWCRPPLERPQHPRLCVNRPVAGAPGLQAANGLAIPVGFVARAFNYDFGVAFTEEQRKNGANYNFRHVDEPEPQKEGMSVFALQDGAVHHTYSTYARGVEALMGTYQFLDLAPWGRNEDGARVPRGVVAPPRRVQQALEPSRGCRWRTGNGRFFNACLPSEPPSKLRPAHPDVRRHQPAQRPSTAPERSSSTTEMPGGGVYRCECERRFPWLSLVRSINSCRRLAGRASASLPAARGQVGYGYFSATSTKLV